LAGKAGNVSQKALIRAVPALLANIRLGWKGLPGTDALAQLAPLLVTKKKSFITLAPDLSDLEQI
jgi:hypothetical protein